MKAIQFISLVQIGLNIARAREGREAILGTAAEHARRIVATLIARRVVDQQENDVVDAILSGTLSVTSLGDVAAWLEATYDGKEGKGIDETTQWIGDQINIYFTTYNKP